MLLKAYKYGARTAFKPGILFIIIKHQALIIHGKGKAGFRAAYDLIIRKCRFCQASYRILPFLHIQRILGKRLIEGFHKGFLRGDHIIKIHVLSRLHVNIYPLNRACGIVIYPAEIIVGCKGKDLIVRAAEGKIRSPGKDRPEIFFLPLYIFAFCRIPQQRKNHIIDVIIFRIELIKPF